ncbi:MAG: MarR family transcriptional regulator, partial [Pseudomonadota bacterium]
SLVGILDRLEARGLVARIRSEQDRRLVFVKATVAGHALYQQVEPRIAEIHADLKTRATAEEWQALETILQKITAVVPDTSTDAA